MIAYLRGILNERHDDAVIIDVHGVGYHVFMSLRDLHDLPKIGGELELRIATIAREDALLLYGFMNQTSKDFFYILTSVSGVGPKQAMTVLSGCSGHDLAMAVQQGDVGFFERIKGIGKKTAEKLLVSLRSPLEKWLKNNPNVISSPEGEARGAVATGLTLQSDLHGALSQLGYRPQQIDEALYSLQQSSPEVLEQGSVQIAIKWCLRYFAQNSPSPTNAKR